MDREGTVLFLDGLDEVNYDGKPKYIDEINQIAEKYPSLKLILSSRPEYNAFTEFTLFNVYQISRLSLEQAIKLVKKLQFDTDLKERFILSLQNGLYKKNQDFAENPLLLTILIFTFEQCADIPDKLHIFYEYAYQTLFNRHDSYKQRYKRKRLTNLDINEFKKVFSFFCLMTYLHETFEINEQQLIEFINDSLIQTEHSDVKVEDYKTDVLSNVPLLMQDGLEFCFTHRSFQEYFTALYLVNNPHLDSEIFDEIGKRYSSDNVINMIFSMNRQLLEDKWILPNIDKIIKQVSKESTDEAHIKNFSLFFEEITFHNNNEIGFTLKDTYIFVQYFLGQRYLLGDEFEKIREKFFEDDVSYERTDFIELILNNKPHIKVNELNDYEKELFCRMKGYRSADFILNILELTKKRILESRNENVSKIKNLLMSKKK